MPHNTSPAPDRASKLSFWLLVAFLAILWVAGGASRADVLGQSVVRFSAWSIIVVAVLALPRVDWRPVKEPAIILGAAALLVVLQLVPLPPAIWTELPGRAIFAEAAVLIGTDQPWRPLSISPSGTTNTLASLIVPAVVLLLAASLTAEQHWRVATFVIGLVGVGAMLGALQFVGSNFDNPLINTPSGSVAGNFANRNHFALFLAVGCVLALAWGLRGRATAWHMGGAFGFLIVLILMVLATGSRSGLAVALLGVLLSGAAYRVQVIQHLSALPRKLAVLIIIFAIGASASIIYLSFSIDRAPSIDRISTLESDPELRFAIWPIVTDMSWQYFPVGTGFGTFDPVFRISEPDNILNPYYINLVHNDWLQILLEGGMLATALAVFGLIWFILRSIKALFPSTGRTGYGNLPRVGFLVLALVFVASITDYPSRTPMFMAIIALAAVWLTLAKPLKAGDE